MKFSIITPTYNRAHTIERAINSILNQSYQNFEMVIVDDGSTDNTLKIVKKYLNDPRIRYLGPHKNCGVNVARNIGLENIAHDSDWVTFLDSDDEFFIDALDKMKKTITIKDNSLYNYFRFSAVYDNGKEACFAKHDNIVLDYKATLKQEDASGEWVCTLNKTIIDTGFKFEESVNGFESLAWFALSKKEDCIYSLSTVRLYRTDTGGLTRQSKKPISYYENLKNGHKLTIDTFGEDMKNIAPKLLAQKLFSLGNVYIFLGERKEGIKQTLIAMKYDFFSLKIIRNILSLLKNINN